MLLDAAVVVTPPVPPLVPKIFESRPPVGLNFWFKVSMAEERFLISVVMLAMLPLNALNEALSALAEKVGLALPPPMVEADCEKTEEARPTAAVPWGPSPGSGISASQPGRPPTSTSNPAP